MRQPAVAGAFYPSNEESLKSQVDSFLRGEKQDVPGRIKALIVPHAGYPYSGSVAGEAYRLLEEDYERVVIIGPPHKVMVEGLVSDTSEEWSTPLGGVEVEENDFEKSERAHRREHSIEVQVPFLQRKLSGFKIIPLLAGRDSAEKMSKEVESCLDEETLVVVSTDLSHFKTYEEAKKTDKRTIETVKKRNRELLEKEGDACGEKPMAVLLEVAERLNWKSKFLKYMNSGDTGGEKSRVVGYCSFAFYKEEV